MPDCSRPWSSSRDAPKPVRVEDELVEFSFTYENCREGFQGIARELVPVRWGDRRYLIPSGDVMGFCNDVNSGVEPQRDGCGVHLLRRGDERKLATGLPELPPESLSALLQGPVCARVLTVGDSSESLEGLAEARRSRAMQAGAPVCRSACACTRTLRSRASPGRSSRTWTITRPRVS